MMISSLFNKQIMHAAGLKQKKYRDLHGEFLAEGFISVLDTLKAHPDSVSCIFMAEELKDRFFDALGDCAADDLKDKLVFTSPAVLQKLSDTATPQQIIAVVKKRPEGLITELCLYLDRVRDPGNLGTIIRTAAAAGYSLILDDCADIFSPKVARSSMSALSCVDFCFGGTESLRRLRDKGYKIIAADADGKNLYKSECSDFFKDGCEKPNICIVIGNEAQGIKKEILELCDHTVSIPLIKMESLNAAVSAAIMMYHFKYSILELN